MKFVIINEEALTYEEAHRMLWSWLSENPNHDNEDFFKVYDCSEPPLNDCFACEIANRDCSQCPVKWTFYEAEIPCYAEYGIVGKHGTLPEEKRRLQAKLIADLPWKTKGWSMKNEK